MSVKIEISIACDKEGCLTSIGGAPTEKARAIRAVAKGYGWKLGKQRDFCPKHAAEIAEAIKNAAAGNL